VKTHPMSLFDYSFFLMESKENPKHVAKLMIFRKPQGAKKTFLKDLQQHWLRAETVVPPFNSKLAYTPLGKPVWSEVDHIDLDKHLFYHCLSKNTGRKKLYAFICDLHNPLSELDRPHWGMHLIDNVEGDCFAVYIRIHHAYVDGLSFIQLLISMMAKTPDELYCKPFWQYQFPNSDKTAPSLPASLRNKTKRGISGALGLGRITTQILLEKIGFTHSDLTVPFEVENSILTGQIEAGREFVTTSITLDRVSRIRKPTRSSLNHVVLACLDGAVHRYLDEIGHPIDGPLVISMAVNLREDVGKLGGNSVGMVPVKLAPKTRDPFVRIREIGHSLRAVRHQVDNTSTSGLAAYTIATLAMPQLAELFNMSDKTPALSHTVVSNVPGPSTPLYINGAEAEEAYFVSALPPGQNLNVTVSSYNGTLYYGLLAAKDALPRLDRLVDYINLEYQELEALLTSSDLGIGSLTKK
jgi:diacylglycerol O-acyltransferase